MNYFLPKDFSFGPYAQICSFLFMFSPIPLFIEVIRGGNTTKLPNLTFPSLAIMQLGWGIYGFLVSNTAIYNSSMMQLVAYTIYSTLSFFLKKEARKIIILYGILIVLGLIYQGTPAVILGTIACGAQLISSSTNLELIFKSLKERDGSYFNVGSLLMALPAGLIWGLYGVEIKDAMVIIPSFYDLTLYFIQLLLAMVFVKDKTTKKE